MKTETAVGLFVCGALAAALFLVSYLGLIRFSSPNAAVYNAPLREAAGLVRRAEVRIAGVKVGYVEQIALSGDTAYPVLATIAVDSSCQLHSGASAFVRQDGLLGGRYLELNPGSSEMPVIAPNEMLAPAQARGGTVEDLFERMAQVSDEMRAVARITREYITNEENRAFLADMTLQIQDLSQEVARCMKYVRRAAPAVIDEVDSVLSDVHAIVDRADRVSRQLEQGEGTLGKLLTDDALYTQAQTVGKRVVSIIETVDHTTLGVDGWNEWLLQNPICPGACYNQKSYVSLLLEPPNKFFGLLGLVGTPCGTVDQCFVVDDTRNCSGHTHLVQPLSPYLFNIQLGIRHPYGAVRMGVIESTIGAALDLATPWWHDIVRLESSLWAYDFRGRNRLCDDRPHLKWINRLFLTPSICFVAGIDDFVSCRTRNVFVGAGISLDETTLNNLFFW